MAFAINFKLIKESLISRIFDRFSIIDVSVISILFEFRVIISSLLIAQKNVYFIRRSSNEEI